MNEEKIRKIADEADMVIRGYAFKKKGDFIHIFNTNDGISAMVITADGMMVESNMDEIEQALVQSIWHRDAKYMEM